MTELYLSFDIETDGPAPGVNSMLSLGCALIDPRKPEDEMVISTFSRNFLQLKKAKPNADTMAWWATQPREAWDRHRLCAMDPAEAMREFSKYIRFIKYEYADHKIVPAAWPAGFDWAFLNYYCWRYLNVNPLGYQCLDMRSYFNGAFKEFYLEQCNPTLDGFKPKNMPHLMTHDALDDAIVQGIQFGNFIAWHMGIDRG